MPGHPLGEQVAALFRSAAPATVAGIGSVLLLPEVLAKPLRDDATDEVRILAALLARLDLRPVDRATAELATALSSRYRLKAADATHLATAVGMGADRFITNNKRDFPPTITEIQVTYPADLGPPIVISARWKACWPNWSAAAAPRSGKSRPRSGRMGYVPAVPERQGDGPREVYLGWADPASDYTSGKYTLSLDARTIWFSRQADQHGVRDMPGAYNTAGYVAFRISVPDGVAHAMAAARKVKR